MWRCSWKSVSPRSSAGTGPRTVIAVPRSVMRLARRSYEVDRRGQRSRGDAGETELQLDLVAAGSDRGWKAGLGRLLAAHVEAVLGSERRGDDARAGLAGGRVDQPDAPGIDRLPVDAKLKRREVARHRSRVTQRHD